MKKIKIPGGATTSKLGFGGTVLKGGFGRNENLKLLNDAYEVGFRHFDVAPSYGLGVAESILSNFIGNVRESVTITTKVGLPRPKNSGALAQLRAITRPFISFSPALRKFLGKKVQQVSGSAKTQFDLEFVRSSVAESMRELRTDYVDVLLLHEITPKDVTDELRWYLENLVEKGVVLRYGIGSYRHEAEATMHACPDLTKVMQTSWTVGDSPLDFVSNVPFMITHGALRQMSVLKCWLNEKPSRVAALSEDIGCDIEDPEILGDLMMAAALANNPDGIVLISSARPQRMSRHAAISSNKEMISAGQRFNEVITKGMLDENNR